MKDLNHCADCGAEFPKFPPGNCGGTGYAVLTDSGNRICYACCAERDKEEMKETGKILLYLTDKVVASGSVATVGNWPGTLEMPVRCRKGSINNMGAPRQDVWFQGPDGKEWWGVQVGRFSQLCRCKRIKS